MTSDPTDQTEVVTFLSDPETYGIDTAVETITTHSAYVFLAGNLAFKIKRAVRYNYLDFSTLDARRKVIAHELALNAPAAPAIYDRVVVITREGPGRLALDGKGEPVEYALRMHRFRREDELTSIADAGNLTNDLAEKLGHVIAGLHAVAERRPPDGAALIGEIISELREALDPMGSTLGHDRVANYFDQVGQAFDDVASLLTQRSGEGRVRRCHGDLHLKNLVMIDGQPVPFDALEFDERLGICDVFYDFAFLVMDLLHRGLAGQANVLQNSYLAISRDFTGLATLPLFLSIRAAIRCMVAVQSLSGAIDRDIARDARRYLEQATGFLSPSPPRLVAIGGLSGTGKTTIAVRTAPRLGPSPGAVHLRSDLERKARFGVEPLVRLPEEAYRPEANRDTYTRLMDTAEQVLLARHSVIIDATFLAGADREAVGALAARMRVLFNGIWLNSDAATLERRVATRTADASDADIDVLHAQLKRGTGPVTWTEIDASGDPDQVAELVQAALFSK
ncbi:bifunctional aminoglycoside phosphotransferase/ATP-binding protein [Hoeflea sp.]|uniref:bifunctional aminoglycoside phosphotransferase/ATP-binding protein n=1 Tax=Hoeflea sp. TaxID=1940281 RepID=UPI001989EECE|nr:bifunctional aminoglycoside phosphotransferase/ATP-binding protein [Hoeflea sp.]MBC7283978.1 AAA family ATPase [Hoeflea sp.]